MKKSKQTARKKVLQDLLDQKDGEQKRMRETSFIWRMRAFCQKIEYWGIAFGFPIAIILWVLTGDFWKGIAWYLAVILYSISGNFRGMSLHIENLVEWIIRKNI